MRRLYIPALFALSGCTSPEVAACEKFIAAKLAAPSTYHKVDSKVSPPAKGVRGDGRWLVTIAYDASNAFGAPIRREDVCVFPDKDGRPDLAAITDYDGIARQLRR